MPKKIKPVKKSEPLRDVPKKKKEGKWIPMIDKEVKKYQEEGKLVGYDPAKGVGLLKEE